MLIKIRLMPENELFLFLLRSYLLTFLFNVIVNSMIELETYLKK